ncbi:MAG: NADH-quinone oxidoreductase subunit N [Actinobacteria bacterium]|nr:NADH-quinone oxidoreductase subunit N [Actinomycetota bacterium]
MSWSVFAPEIIVFAVALIALLIELDRDVKRPWLGYVIGMGFIGALVADAVLLGAGVTETAFNGGYRIDALAAAFKAILLAASALVAIATARVSIAGAKRGEFYLLLSLSVLGATMMASAGDLLVLFLSLELTVLPSYALVALKRDGRSTEAALKYFLLGMVASAIFIYGASLTFGLTGSISFTDIAASLSRTGMSPALVIGIITLLAGLGFKIAAVPFHFWAPDVYEGADVPVASYLAVGPKAGGFAAIIRLFVVALGPAATTWAPLFAIIAVGSMLVGNLAALSQTTVRRLLGYSSIAHTGYLLVGLAVVSGYARTSLIFYFLVYSAAVLGAFLIVLAAAPTVGESIEGFAGLSKRAPGLSFAMAVFLFSLVGLPPLAGFIGKFYLFSSAVRGGMVWLAVVGVVNSVISFGYYSNIIRQMYLVKPVASSEVSVPWPLKATIYFLVAAIAVIGIYPSAILTMLNL